MKLNIFEIVLTSSDGVYLSGQTVQGHVILELAQSSKVKDIRVTLRGKAFVHWTEQTMRGPGEVTLKEIRHHSATEEYFNISRTLLGQALDSNHPTKKRVLEAGQYTYRFQFCIPPTCPTSFESRYGCIRYWVKVTLERPWKKDISMKKIFNVICPVDLNHIPSACLTTQNKSEKWLCCLCCTSGPITAEIKLSQMGFVPGETVIINAEVCNGSRRKIACTSVELLMSTIFHTRHKSRALTQQVARLHHGSVPPGSSDSWEGDRLVLPSLPPSFLAGCSIMDIKYTLKLRVFPVGPAFELAVPLEIIIGTVPLHSTLERYLTTHQTTPLTSSRAHNGASASPGEGEPRQRMSSTYSPSHVCSYHVRDDDDDHCLPPDNGYTPRYTIFNFQAVPPKRHHTVRFAT